MSEVPLYLAHEKPPPPPLGPSQWLQPLAVSFQWLQRLSRRGSPRTVLTRLSLKWPVGACALPYRGTSLIRNRLSLGP
eukprot:CAMPEP_0180213646 /NCGR_PEP_ID=MMETSP0987-20121128/14345_1 /TAXON_ID=697907 /ORGANISM="non described non described, Strain CCMP2293" /LENGTH=77 /DNA_ID=CAMNT_0022171795 /DNA_START=1 /DNA_END=230 /DNA_ORIENTATION=+